MSQHADCKYALCVNEELSTLVRRVESLNLVSGMLWPDPLPGNTKDFPVSRYEWLVVATDVFLMRYISIVDCALILTNEIFECGLDRSKCSIAKLKQCRIPREIISVLDELQADQGSLRIERNARFHHGTERGFTSDDQTFRLATGVERWSAGMKGNDRYGQRINVERSFKEGLVELQRDFNRTTRKMVWQLDRLYDSLSPEFEARFVPKFRSGKFEKNHAIGER